jgi:hypothetical protein
MTEACKEGIFMKRLISELLNKDQVAVKLFNDNQSAQKMAHNPVLHNRTKHIAIHHFIRDAVKEKKVLSWVMVEIYIYILIHMYIFEL